MSQLSPFVRAFQALERSLSDQAKDNADRHFTSEAVVLGSMSNAFGAAALDLQQQIASDLSRTGRFTEQPPVEPCS